MVPPLPDSDAAPRASRPPTDPSDGAVSSDPASLERLLASFTPFALLTLQERRDLCTCIEPRRYRLGQTLLRQETLPDGLLLILSGQVRILAGAVAGETPTTIDRLGPGAILGWAGLVRHHPCETARARSDVAALHLPAGEFQALLQQQPRLAAWFHGQLTLAELHQVLSARVAQDPSIAGLLEQWSEQEHGVTLLSLPAGETPAAADLQGGRSWIISSGGPLGEIWSEALAASLPEPGSGPIPWLRLVALHRPATPAADPLAADTPADPIPATATALVPLPESAGVYSLSPPPPPPRQEGQSDEPLRLPRASGPRDVPLAICIALARYFNLPLNRDTLLDFIDATLRRQPRFNLVNAGQLLDYLGLRVILARFPVDRLARVPTPAVLLQHEQLVLLDGWDEDGRVRLLEPELGPLRLPPGDLQLDAEGLLEVLLLERKPDGKEARFNWGWFVPYLMPHRRQLIEVLAASLVVNLLMLATPLGLQVLIDQVARLQNMSALISISALLLLAGVATAVIRTLRSFILVQVANHVDKDSKSTIIDHMVRLPQGFFDSRPVGQIMYYFSMLDRLREFLVGQSLTTLVDFLFSILFVFILIALSPMLSVVTLSTLPLLLILGFVSTPIYENQVTRSLSEAVNTYSYLNESITGIQTIKSQNAELKTRWEFLNRYSRFIGEDFKLRLTSESVVNIANFIAELNGLLVIGFGIWLVMQSKLTLGGFIAFRIISGYVIRPLVSMVQTWQQFRMTTAQLRAVSDVVDRPTEQSLAEATNIPMPPVSGKVDLEDVSFRFSDEGPLVLQHVSLSIPTGCFVGMVGGSGSGKSTVLKLLPRFYRPLEGKVKIDGFDVTKVELYSLRRQIGVVPQDSLLFDGTIRENLLLVKPDASADELIQAARIACAHEFIMDMPQGYNSSVGERGAGLSGGQRQRIAIARAVLQNPRMLILDEATSALDARTERQVCINLLDAFRGRTVFFITHRLSTVRPADLIVLMDRGAVMETGTHQQLMELRGWYYALFRSQNQEEGA
ncbi:MAG: peptidase domain-containing ABC transporter [Synechococcaceae cyanobacterium]|nr:peptidase domain-containing ABC transporter [Synechococcaceae cyanobacterium]